MTLLDTKSTIIILSNAIQPIILLFRLDCGFLLIWTGDEVILLRKLHKVLVDVTLKKWHVILLKILHHGSPAAITLCHLQLHPKLHLSFQIKFTSSRLEIAELKIENNQLWRSFDEIKQLGEAATDLTDITHRDQGEITVVQFRLFF